MRGAGAGGDRYGTDGEELRSWKFGKFQTHKHWHFISSRHRDDIFHTHGVSGLRQPHSVTSLEIYNSRSLGSLLSSLCSPSTLRAGTLRNKQGQTRLSSYYEWVDMVERTALESEIIRKCLSRSELQCSFLEYRGFKVIYRRYASLFFIVGTKADLDTRKSSLGAITGGKDGSKSAVNFENELGLLEFIHTLVETMDRWAGSICELDIMYQLEQVHFLVDEMVMNGYIVETNKSNVLRPIDLIDRESKKNEGMFR